MEFTSSNVQDIEKYYHNTYVKFKEFGDKLFFIDHVSSSEICGSDDDGEQFRLYLSDAFPYNVDYVLPHKAIFPYKDSLYLLQRIPARQYKKGLCTENTQIISLLSGERQQIGFPLLKEFVGKKAYLSFKQAFSTKGKVKAVALSSRMWYNREKASINIDRIAIGYYNSDDGSINLHFPCFLDEVNEHLSNNNETIKVNVK